VTRGRPGLQPPTPVEGRPWRLLAVHAHPDDETLATGVALAHHVARGDRVHVITCTLGEEGEVIPAELAHLEGSELLGPHRQRELHEAMAELGAQHEFLGGTLPRWRDSGMAGSPSATHPKAFAGADVDEVAALLGNRIRALRPQIVLTYDESGGYGHPDHIQTHRVTVAAVRSVPATERPNLYAVLTPRSWALQDRAWLAAHVDPSKALTVPGADADLPPSVVRDDLVGAAVRDPAAVPVQVRALRRHRTQVRVHEGYYSLSNDVAARLPGREGYARIDAESGLPAGAGHG